MLHDFSYSRPQSLKEALAFLAEHGSETTVFSGGTDLFVSIRSGLDTPAYVMDLKGIPELNTIRYDDATGLSIGACVTINQLLEYPAVAEKYAVLHDAVGELATYQLRNRATVIGNVVTASPCGDTSSPLMVLGGEVTLASASGERTIPLAEFITGVKTTLIKPEEIVSRITVPPTWAGVPGGYKKLKRIKGHDLGLVMVAMIRHPNALRFAIGSAAPTPVLLSDFTPGTTIKEVQTAAQKAISPIDDVRCTKEYRRFMVDVFIKRLMEEVGA